MKQHLKPVSPAHEASFETCLLHMKQHFKPVSPTHEAVRTETLHSNLFFDTKLTAATLSVWACSFVVDCSPIEVVKE
jgi:hypothetical protein